MGKVRKISKRYYFRQIAACWLVSCMLFALPVQVAMAIENPAAGALPSGHSVAAGIVGQFDYDTTNQLHLRDVANGTVINWTNFDIGSDAWTEFQQLGGPTSAVLNRVHNGDVTGIMGSLTANGRVFIVNPAGVIFGSGASVNVAQLVASSLDIENSDFLNGLPYTFTGSSGAVVNDGEIIAQGVALLGQGVLNTGTITTSPGGFVIMAAGDRVVLSQVGSSIVVEIDEMSSATGSIEDIEEAEVGEVINEDTGTITSPGGTVVLAAGDIFSVPLHPQLAGKTARVETGTGRVEQSGEIYADGGSVVLTAGNTNAEEDDDTTLEDDIPDVVLSAGSITQALGGEVVTYAYDFATKGTTSGAITSFEEDAMVNVGTGTASISGNHVLFAGSVNAEPGGTIQVDPVTLTIADTMPVTGPELDTLYEEEHVEFYSQAGVNLELAADELITVEYMSDGEILGGSGDIMLRNVFDDGGIYFKRSDEDTTAVGPRTTIRTTAYYVDSENYRDGGNIYMDAGSNGIVAGDLLSGILSKDKFSQPGDIILRTSNGGDITVDTMQAIGAIETQVSAISDGDLTVNGDAESISQQTDNEQQSVFKALLCLIAEGDVILNGDVYKVETKGKGSLTSDIRISAGENVYIATDPLTGEATGDAKITATSRVAGGATQSTAYIVIHAGRNLYDQSEPPEAIPGVIAINGEEYVSGSKFAGNDDIMAISWPATGKLSTDTYDNTPTQDDTKSEWLAPGSSENFFAKIEINNNEIVPLNEGPCKDCPSLPGLPPVPHIFIIPNDSFTVGWAAEDAPLDVLEDDDTDEFGDPTRLILGDIADPQPIITDLGGTLTVTILTDEFGDPILDEFDNPIIGFEYTPPSGVDFTWDGVSDYASFKDTFFYKAEDAEENVSVNTATVTITVTNFLPTASPDSDTIHMDDTAIFGLAAGGLITDSDGSPGDLDLIVSDPVFGDSSLSDTTADTDATYTPFDGFVGGDSFDYTVTDSTIVYPGDVTPESATATLTITVENELPTGAVVLEDAHMDAVGEELGVDSGDFTDGDDDDFVIASIVKATDDDNKTFGGTLDYNGDNTPYNDDVDETYDYTADAALPGYVGEDDFDVQLWDGQYDYELSETPVEGFELFVDNAEGPDIYRAKVYGTGTIDLVVTNELPSGAVVLEDAPMDAVGEELSVDSGDFTDGDDDDFVIASITRATDDYNKTFGGTLDYNGDNSPYNDDVDGTYDYTADASLPGYVGEDDFDVQLWDGQKDYTFELVGEEWVETGENVYGAGTIDLLVTNELPEGDAWFGQVHMDSEDVTQDLEIDFGEDVTIIEGGPYDGSVIGSDLYGGSLSYNSDTEEWTYSTPAELSSGTHLPGYVGDEYDNFDTYPVGIETNADDLFTVNLSNGQYDYWFEEGPAPEGYEFYEPAEIYRKAAFGEGNGTVSVDITNVLPTIDEETTIEHMNEDIINQLFAEDQLDGNPISELDDLTITDNSYPGFGSLTLIDNGDGTYSYTYEPAEGYVGDDSFDVTVWDGQTDYVFVDGEIDSATPVTVEGTVSMELTNIIPSAEGNLGEVAPADPPIPQDGLISPVLVIDPPDDPQQDIPDTLSIVPGVYVSSSGSTLEFTGSEWIYTPAPGAPDEETFTINVWDGQYNYFNIEEREPVYGVGTVVVGVTPPPPPPLYVPPPPLVRELVEYSGCPVLLQAAATELGTTAETIQISIAQAMATAPNIQPCDACANLVNYASVLRDTEGAYLEALAQVVNEFAASDAPPSEEEMASIADAIARNTDDGTHYAAAGQYLDALAQYVGLLNDNFGYPVVESVAFAADKYVGPLAEKTDNVAVSIYVASRLGEIAGQ